VSRKQAEGLYFRLILKNHDTINTNTNMTDFQNSFIGTFSSKFAVDVKVL